MPSKRSKPSKPPKRSKRSKPPRPKPTASLAIIQYMHCRKCLEEIQDMVRRTGQSQSPATYSRYDIGFTKLGLQVWCRRHEINIVHIDFEGQQHPANLSGERTKED